MTSSEFNGKPQSPTPVVVNVAPPTTVRWIVDIIRDVGFPIFVALYLLMQLSPRMESMALQMAKIADTQERIERLLRFGNSVPGSR